MNKTLYKIISAALLGVSLCTIGTAVMPSIPVQASIEEDGLKNQCIYREGDYIIAKENASYTALIQTVWIEFNGYNTIFEGGYAAPNYVGTKTYEDGTTVTVEENGEGYVITYKINKNMFTDLDNCKAKFVLERTGGGGMYPYYADDNNGQGYSL